MNKYDTLSQELKGNGGPEQGDKFLGIFRTRELGLASILVAVIQTPDGEKSFSEDQMKRRVNDLSERVRADPSFIGVNNGALLKLRDANKDLMDIGSRRAKKSIYDFPYIRSGGAQEIKRRMLSDYSIKPI